MIASYNFTGSAWQLLDDSSTIVDTFLLTDTFVELPHIGRQNSQVISRISGSWIAGVTLSENDATKRRFLSNQEIVAMGLIDVGTLTAQFDHDKASALDDSGGGEGDIISDHYADTASATYYYYGYNRNGVWEFTRNLKTDINVEETATPSLNPSIVDLNDAITNRTILIYA